jgi:TolA-binding protein
MPIVRGVYEEGLEARTNTRMARVRTHEHSNIEQLTERINEIEKKIRIIKMQNISEEAKNIIIRELEEEKKRLEEEIKKYRY